MIEFYNNLSTIEQIYWAIAIIASFILLIVFVFTFFGFDTDTDFDSPDVDFDVDSEVGFQFFTFKNLVAFFAVFGWTGLTCLNNNCSTGWTLVVSIIAGTIMMVITATLFFFMYKLEEKGNLDLSNTIGKTAKVYLPIDQKIGKVNLKVQGTYRELDAITKSKTKIPTGSLVKIIDVIDDDILLVEKIN